MHSTVTCYINCDFVIDGDYARLSKVEEKIFCKKCNRVLALKNRESTMIKTQITILIKNGIILRCGHCKVYNILEYEGNQLLAV